VNNSEFYAVEYGNDSALWAGSQVFSEFFVKDPLLRTASPNLMEDQRRFLDKLATS
jgi:hypothetical protein